MYDLYTFQRTFIPELEEKNMKTSDMNRTINANELLLDLKDILGDYYIAKIERSDDAIMLHFSNGQQFMLRVEER